MLWAEREFQVHQSGGETPRHFLCGDYMRELSIFVDESGDFGPYSSHSPYYLFTLLFHNQENSINTKYLISTGKCRNTDLTFMLFIQNLSYKMKDIIKIFLPMIGKGCLMIYCCLQDIDSFAKGISFALNQRASRKIYE